MITKTARHPTGVEIYFSADEHTYHDSQSRVYESVTSIVLLIFPPFDADAISTRKALRDGVDAAALRAEWVAKGAIAAADGTRCHEVAEDAILGRKPRHTPRTPKERAAFCAVWDAAQVVREKSASVHPEVILADPASCTAGQADLISIKKDQSGLIITDWKTWREPELNNKYGNRALEPYTHLHDTNMVHAALQLAIYAWILRNSGYFRPDETITTVIGHIAPDATEVSWLALPDLSREADAIMQARRADVGRIRALSNRIRETFAADAALDANIPPELQDP